MFTMKTAAWEIMYLYEIIVSEMAPDPEHPTQRTTELQFCVGKQDIFVGEVCFTSAIKLKYK